jgi:hypothetical protein
MDVVGSKAKCGSRHQTSDAEDGSNGTYLPAAAAPYVGSTEATLRTWRHQGKGPVYYKDPSGQITYRKSDLDTFNETRRPRRIVPGEKRSAA